MKLVNKKKAEIRSEEVQEIMESAPNWLLRWGMTISAVVFLGLLCLSWFIKYPDTISGKMILSSENPPIILLSPQEGELSDIYFSDGQYVEKESIIAQIKNPLSVSDVEYLIDITSDIDDQIENDNLSELSFSNDRHFGSIQDYFDQLVKSISEFNYMSKDSFYSKSKQILESKIYHRTKLRNSSKRQLAYSLEGLEIEKSKYEINKVLFDSEVLSKIDFLTFRESLSNKKQLAEYANAELLQHSLILEGLKEESNKLLFEERKLKRELKHKIKNFTNAIKSYIEDWQNHSVIINPISGVLSFITRVDKHMNVNEGDKLFAVIPESGSYKAIVRVPHEGIGKISIGNNVNILFSNYPFREYGAVKGIVNSISRVPDDKFYLVNVDLPKGLITTHEYQMQYQPEMVGIAEIITHERRLIERFFQSLRISN